LFPFDVNEGVLSLSWEAGVDAFFYRELDLAAGKTSSRIPKNFNWPRFRELFNDETINESVRSDPWLVNWRRVAERTIASSFDRRQLVPEQKEGISIPVTKGPWYGASPFAEALLFGDEAVFPVLDEVEIWISSQGILRCNQKAWIFQPW
jgi:hypothetical protein